jgi:uncharacterized protein (TIGR00269 family)
MTKTCSKCKKPSVTYIRYNGTHLCQDHFIEYFEKRVKKDFKKQGKTQGPAKIGVAVSGGKDSITTLHIVHDIFSKRKEVEIVCITVDEGIKGYRDKSLKYVKDNCKLLDVKSHIISFKEVTGLTMDEIAAKKDELGECSYCGVFRRLCLNTKSKELGVTKLATGHNLDDMAQSILMNFVSGDIKKLARLGPHKKVQPGLIPRIMPLRSIPEKENMLYAILKDFKFHDAECPYSVRALRGSFRNIVDALEYQTPGARHSILNSYDTIKDMLLEKYPPANLNKCKICGEPTNQKLCRACILKKRIS